MTSVGNLLDVFNSESSGNAPYVTSSQLVGSSRVSLIRVRNNPAGHYPDPPCDDFSMTLVTRGKGYGEFDFGAGRFTCPNQKGHLSLVPPMTAADFQIHFDFDLCVLGLPPKLFEDARSAYGTHGSVDMEKLHTNSFRDSFVEQLVQRVFAEAAAGGPNGSLFADQAAALMALSLLGLADKLKKQHDEARPLSDVVLAKVRDLVEDRIDEKITLDELAALAGWDIYRFSRSFRNTTGQPPHQYVLSRRIERARDMIANSAEPLAEIAFATGFSSQQHMTNLFSKHVGVSPAKYRREIQS